MTCSIQLGDSIGQNYYQKYLHTPTELHKQMEHLRSEGGKDPVSSQQPRPTAWFWEVVLNYLYLEIGVLLSHPNFFRESNGLGPQRKQGQLDNEGDMLASANDTDGISIPTLTSAARMGGIEHTTSHCWFITNCASRISRALKVFSGTKASPISTQ